MKNLFALLCVLAVIGTANAVYLTDNGDFESAIGPGEGWGVWAGGGAVATENLSGGNPNQFVSISCGATGWAGWFNQDGVGGELDVLGIPAGETVTIACDIKSLSGSLTAGGLKAESWAGGVGGASVGESTNGWPLTITTSWANYSIDYTLTTDATELVVSMMNLAIDDGGSTADIGFDNITVDAGGRALRPIPTVGALYPVDTTITWENPASVSSVNVYWFESDTPVSEPNMGPTFDTGVVELTTVDAGLESATVTMNPDKYYYWAVNVTDANTPAAVHYGYVWNFQASGDSIPIVDAGADQYLESTEVSPMVLSLSATVSDDEDAGPVSISWTDITAGGDKDPGTTVTINSATTAATTVSLTNADATALTGWYQFEISVDDGVNAPVVDTVAIGVYPTCADAAAADPADGWVSVGDIDGDCKANLTDFALFAAAWLDCNSNRVTCP